MQNKKSYYYLRKYVPYRLKYECGPKIIIVPELNGNHFVDQKNHIFTIRFKERE